MEASFNVFTAQTNHANMLRVWVSRGAGTTLFGIRREYMERFLIATNGLKDRQLHDQVSANPAHSHQGFEYLNIYHNINHKKNCHPLPVTTLISYWTDPIMLNISFSRLREAEVDAFHPLLVKIHSGENG